MQVHGSSTTNEKGTTWVLDLFAQNCSITCSSLGYVELMATLARKRKAREIDSGVFEKNINELENDRNTFIQVALTDEIVDIACKSARNFSLKGADAVHLASALFLKSRFEDENDHLVFIAADRELKEIAGLSGLEVIDPEYKNSQNLKTLDAAEQKNQDK